MPDPGVIEYYTALFAGRTDIYSRWTPDGWRPVKEPLTPGVVEAGLSGTGPSVSSYFADTENRCHVAALDFDRDDGVDLGLAVARAMWTDDAMAFVEPSRRGCHLWAIFGPWSDGAAPFAKTIRRAMLTWMDRAGIPSSPDIEMRPVADDARGGYGHALRMPLMPHPKTGKRYIPVDYRNEPVARGLKELLLEVEHIPRTVYEQAAMEYRPPPLSPSDLPATYRPPRRRREEDEGSATEILTNLYGIPNARPGIAVRCPRHDDRHASLHIFRHDERVLCYSPACDFNNNGHGRGLYELRTMANAG